jgi:hypothetical protein
VSWHIGYRALLSAANLILNAEEEQSKGILQHGALKRRIVPSVQIFDVHQGLNVSSQLTMAGQRPLSQHPYWFLERRR